MRRWLVALSITAAGCEASNARAPAVAPASVASSPHAVSPPPVAPATPPVASSSSPDPTPVASSSPPPVASPPIADELASAPAWIYRDLQAGALRPNQVLTTYTLRRLGTQAVLTELTQSAVAPIKGPTGPFGPGETRTFVGSVESDGAKVRLKLQHGTEQLDLSCRAGSVSAASATAVRVRTPGIGSCGGDRGQWSPRAVTSVAALRCGPLPKGSDPDRTDEYVFAASPGVEFLFVNDDCVIQGGGYRLVASDASIAPTRPPVASTPR